MSNYHTSVLLQETIDFLNVQKGKRYIDATLGGGGHTSEILDRGGIVLSLDVDQDALNYVEEKFKVQNSKFKINKEVFLVKRNFKDIDKAAREFGFEECAGIVFDLGMSSHQLETDGRGFSFTKNGPLDMRMDRELNVQAKDLLHILTKGELYELFISLGEERFSWAIAQRITRARKITPITTTNQLSELIAASVPAGLKRLDAQARIFQALRIAVNDEMNNLKIALAAAIEVLAAKGRIAIISFHSLEDRIVKNQFLQWERDGLGKVLTKKPLSPGESEIGQNNRSRSAKLRVFQKS